MKEMRKEGKKGMKEIRKRRNERRKGGKKE